MHYTNTLAAQVHTPYHVMVRRDGSGVRGHVVLQRRVAVVGTHHAENVRRAGGASACPSRAERPHRQRGGCARLHPRKRARHCGSRDCRLDRPDRHTPRDLREVVESPLLPPRLSAWVECDNGRGMGRVQ